ncbi:MAG: hypothetical protein Q9218_003659 [Villophora microphyllina]
MDFGGVSDHIHAIKGGSAFSPTSTADDLLKSKCQSCGVGQDKSVYWAPPLYYQADDGTVTLVPEKPPFKAYVISHMKLQMRLGRPILIVNDSYYELNTGSTSDGKAQKIEAFPNGFQMISGNNYRRNTTLSGPDPSDFVGPFTDETNDEREQRAIGFNCMNYGHNGSPAKNEPTLYRHSLPEKSWLDSNCPDGLRLELQFPSCWNGNMDGGEKHKSHVAFPNWINGGDCPAGFDRRLPSLMYETIYGTDQFIGKGGKFVLGNGDPTGYGYHGDFIAAWDEGVLQQAIEQCTDLGGEMRSCGVFEFPENTASCELENLPGELKDENTAGPMQGLPGGCEVQTGPEQAKKGKGATGSSSGGKSSGSGSSSSSNSVVAPVVKDTSKSSSSNDDKEDKKEDRKENVVVAPVENNAENYQAPAAPAPSPTTTTAPVVPNVLPAGEVLSTSIYTDGRIVHENVVVIDEVTITQGGAAKAKRTPEVKAKRHGHRHHHGGRRLR